MIAVRRLVLFGLLLLGACLDEQHPTSPSSDGPSGDGSLEPATAWIETGGRVHFELVPPKAFSLRVDAAAVGRVEGGSDFVGLGLGTATIQALFSGGKDEARGKVVPAIV